MIRPRTRRSVRGLAVVAAAVAALAVLAGCSTIRGLIRTEEALARAGFSDADVTTSSDSGFDQVEITVRPPASGTAPDASAETAARVVWTTFPLRFDLLRVSLSGSADGFVATYTYGEMAEIFGPRDPDLDEKDVGGELVRAGLGVMIVLAVGGMLFLAAVVLAIVYGVRTSRRRAAAAPPPWPPAPRS